MHRIQDFGALVLQRSVLSWLEGRERVCSRACLGRIFFEVSGG